MIECEPTVNEFVLKVATPAPFKVTGEPSTLVPSLNVIVPEGAGAPGDAGATVAVNVTEFPESRGAALEVNVIPVPAWSTRRLISGAPFQQSWVARGMAIGDLDNDGRVDAVVTTNEGPVHILHNETPAQNHWLTLELVGHKSNRDAIGAVVKVITADLQQTTTVSTTGSYLSSSDKRVHFGLGKEDKALKTEIRWPSGIEQTLENVAADRILRIDKAASP